MVNIGLYAPMGAIIQPRISDAAEATPPYTGPNRNVGNAVNIPANPTFMPDAPNSGMVNEKGLHAATSPRNNAVIASFWRFCFAFVPGTIKKTPHLFLSYK